MRLEVLAFRHLFCVQSPGRLGRFSADDRVGQRVGQRSMGAEERERGQVQG